MMVKFGKYIFWQAPFGPSVDEMHEKLLPTTFWMSLGYGEKRITDRVYVPNFHNNDFKLVLKRKILRVLFWKSFIFWEGFRHHCTIFHKKRPPSVKENIENALAKALIKMIEEGKLFSGPKSTAKGVV